MQIAAGFGDRIRVFEPTPLSQHNSAHGLDYRWFETADLHLEHASQGVHGLSWNLEGMRFVPTLCSPSRCWTLDGLGGCW